MSRHKSLLILAAASLFFTLALCGAAGAAEITVSTTIQAAIDAANAGDVVIVPQGTYNETIDFKGKAITVRSVDPADPAVVAATIIDGGKAGKATVTFASGEGPDSVLTGLTITNGGTRWPEWYDGGAPYDTPGGGIYCRESSPTISGNVIAGNEAGGGDECGAGVLCEGGAPLIEGNRIESNFAAGAGAGIACSASAAVVRNNVVSGNTAYRGYGGGVLAGSGVVEGNTICGNYLEDGGGGGINAGSGDIINNVICDNWSLAPGGLSCYGVSPNIVNNTIVGNYGRMDTGVGGIKVEGGAPVIKNCIIWNNDCTADSYADYDFGGSPTVSYCVLGEGYVKSDTVTWGEGLMYTNPLFAGPGDYHLCSVAGRWDPTANDGAGGWVTDAVSSPCIDAGDPQSPYANEPDPNGGRVNMGAYGNTAEASKTGQGGTIRIDGSPEGAPWTLAGPNNTSVAGKGDVTLTATPGRYRVTWVAMDGSQWPWVMYDRPRRSSAARAVRAGRVTVFTGVYRACTPELYPEPGAYATPTSVNIGCDTYDAVVHYTTDGTTPTKASPVYGGPIDLPPGKTTIKAIAFPRYEGPAASYLTKGVYTVSAGR